MTEYNGQDFHNWYKTPSSMQFSEFGFPIMQPVREISADLKVKPFSQFARNTDLGAFLHFYQEDHKFARVWNKPEVYLDALRKYAGIFAPDFSLYADTPIPMQAWNHYRKQWCGAYWQAHGLLVIPTVGWGSEESFSFCFDGVPKHSVVTVSALGIVNDKQGKANFIAGYNRMLEALEPSKILFFSGARLHKQLEGPIQYIGNTKAVRGES